MRRLAWMLMMLAAVRVYGVVDIPSPTVATMSPDGVARSCDGMSARACTQFREATLLCECREEGGRWRLLAAARAVPAIYVSSASWLGHEMLHIWDFKYFLRAHVAALERSRLATLAECEALARAAAEAFQETMRRVARLSADRRDGRRSQRSEDHLVVVQAKVVPELVDDRFANLADYLAPAARHAENRPAKDGDLVGKGGKHVVAALGKGHAPVDAQQLVVVRSFAQNVAVLVGRLFLDDHDDVVEQPGKLVRQLLQSLFDELVEFRRA